MTKDIATKAKDTSKYFDQYYQNIQLSLDNALDYVSLFKELNKTNSSEQLLKATIALTNFRLNNDTIKFPNQFSDEDVYLIFMERLLSLHNLKNHFKIASVDKISKLKADFVMLKSDSFYFVKSTKDQNGFFFTNSKTYLPLFYLNLDTKEMLFNSNALIEYFVVQKADEGTDLIKNTIGILLEFSKILKEEFGFKVDFNILDSTNGELYLFAGGDLDESIMDELFVKAAENKFMLTSGTNDEAILDLNNNTQVTLLNSGSDNRPKWGATVRDSNQKESWFDLLLDYGFIKDWYLKNQKQLEILSSSLIFG